MPEQRTLAEIPGVREEIERSTGRPFPDKLWDIIGGMTPAEAAAWNRDFAALSQSMMASTRRFLATLPPPPPA